MIMIVVVLSKCVTFLATTKSHSFCVCYILPLKFTDLHRTKEFISEFPCLSVPVCGYYHLPCFRARSCSSVVSNRHLLHECHHIRIDIYKLLIDMLTQCLLLLFCFFGCNR